MNPDFKIIDIKYMKQNSKFINEIEKPTDIIPITKNETVNNFLATFNKHFSSKQLSEDALNDFIYYADLGLMRLDFIINRSIDDNDEVIYIIEVFLYNLNVDYIQKLNSANTYDNMDIIDFETTEEIFMRLINICYEHKYHFSLDYFIDSKENN